MTREEKNARRRARRKANPEATRKEYRDFYHRHKDKLNRKTKLWRAAKPLYHRDKALRETYGISHEDYLEMFRQQEGVCAACSSPPKDGRFLVVDHDHVTGLVRGLLCYLCNRIAGDLEHKNLALVQAYLSARNYKPGSTFVDDE